MMDGLRCLGMMAVVLDALEDAAEDARLVAFMRLTYLHDLTSQTLWWTVRHLHGEVSR